jgi:hypothetical protein
MRGIGAGTRIFELLDRRAVIPPITGIELPPTRRGTLKFEGIRFEYPSRPGVGILKDFELEIGVGESVVIVYGSNDQSCVCDKLMGITGERVVVESLRCMPYFCVTMIRSRERSHLTDKVNAFRSSYGYLC